MLRLRQATGMVSVCAWPAEPAALGQRRRVRRAVDVLEQVLRRSGLGAVAVPAG